MPTLKGVDNLGKCADDKKKSNIIESDYLVNKSNFPQLWQGKLFKEGKEEWVAGRSVTPIPNGAYFYVRNLSFSSFYGYPIVGVRSDEFNPIPNIGKLRVVTTLTLDSSAEVTKEDGAWKITAK